MSNIMEDKNFKQQKAKFNFVIIYILGFVISVFFEFYWISYYPYDYFIDALTKIENNHLNSNRNNAIYSMLKEIGLYTKALYVSIYELVDSSAFELTHQWRLFNNTESPNHDLILPTDGVPCIFNILYQGESIILDDIESIKDSMPTEYNFFWK
jgi:hypothetical protein